MKFKKIISTTLIFLISNFSTSCSSSHMVDLGTVEAIDTLLDPQYEKIASVINKDGREIKFYANTGRYSPEERIISGTSRKRGPGNSWLRGDFVMISLDDALSVKVVKSEPVKTAAAILAIPVGFLVMILVVGLDFKFDCEGDCGFGG